MCSDKPCESSNPYPPVSTSSTYRGGSPIGRGVETRSRVTPGMSCTMLIIFPAIAFSSELLPTFGRPTIAMTGREDIGVVGWGSWVGVVYCYRTFTDASSTTKPFLQPTNDPRPPTPNPPP